MQVKFSNDGSALATANYNDEICFYDTRTWKVHKQIKFPREVNSIMWNQDDTVLFIADSSGKLNLYDGQVLDAVLDQPLAELQDAHSTRCECVAIHPDNQSFASGGQDSLIVFWDMYELMSSGSVSSNDF